MPIGLGLGILVVKIATRGVKDIRVQGIGRVILRRLENRVLQDDGEEGLHDAADCGALAACDGVHGDLRTAEELSGRGRALAVAAVYHDGRVVETVWPGHHAGVAEREFAEFGVVECQIAEEVLAALFELQGGGVVAFQKC